MNEEVLLLKLTNGLDCIGAVASRDLEAGTITFKKLRLLRYVESGPAINIGFQMFLIPAEDADLSLKESDMLCCIPAPGKITEGYLQATSPIQLAKTIPQGVGRIIEGKLQ